MKHEIKVIFENLFRFTINAFLSQNPEDYISKNAKYNHSDDMYVCTTDLKLMSIIKERHLSPVIYIHESSVIPEAVALWYHGLDCAELITPFTIEVEYNGFTYEMEVSYEKDTKWFMIKGNVLDIVWNNTNFLGLRKVA